MGAKTGEKRLNRHDSYLKIRMFAHKLRFVFKRNAINIYSNNSRIYLLTRSKFTGHITCYILTSTKNASLIITAFLAMIYKNEQPSTASLCRGWAMLENDFNLICRLRVIPMTSYWLNVHMTAFCMDRL